MDDFDDPWLLLAIAIGFVGAVVLSTIWPWGVAS